jgi:hypothetical protein
VGKLSQQMSGVYAATSERCALVHQLENRAFSLAADHGYIRQVDHQLAIFK